MPELLEPTLHVVFRRGPVEDLWDIFSKMNTSQSIAAGSEPWYVEEGRKRPAAGTYGINTGMLAMNLTRLRSAVDAGLGETLQNIIVDQDPPPRHDQDALNIFLVDRPEMLHELSARYNFIPSSCLKVAPKCKDCTEKGILVLHGADSSFYRLVDAKSKDIYHILYEATDTLEDSLPQLLGKLEHQMSYIDSQGSRFTFMCQHYENYNQQLLHHARAMVASTLS